MVRGLHFTNHWSDVVFGRYFIQIRADRPTILREHGQIFQANAETVSQIKPRPLQILSNSVFTSHPTIRH